MDSLQNRGSKMSRAATASVYFVSIMDVSIIDVLFQLQVITDVDIGLLVTIQHLCQQIYYTSFGINFVLYCISGQNFRKALRCFRCLRRRRLRRNETAALTGLIFEFTRQHCLHVDSIIS